MNLRSDFENPEFLPSDEEKRLSVLFDALLQEEKVSINIDQLASDFIAELTSLNLDAPTCQELSGIFLRSFVNQFYENERLRLISILQMVKTKDLSIEEYASIKRLEFMFALALPTDEERLSFGDLAACALPETTVSILGAFFDNPSDLVAKFGSRQEDSAVPIAKIKTKILWDILSDEHPQNVDEFRHILRDKGIILRHSS